MMLAIAILAGIGFIFSVIKHMINDNKLDCDIPITAILIISLWEVCFPLAIIVLGIVVVMLLFAIADR